MSALNPSVELCRYFFKPSGCRFGRNCKFAHHVGVTDNPQTAASTEEIQGNDRNARQENENGGRAGLVRWRSQIPLRNQFKQPLGPRLSSFLQTALDLIGNDAGITQEVVTALVSEGDLLRLRQLLNQSFSDLSDTETRVVLQDQLMPFFKIITHLDVASSITLEDKLGTIYNYLYGQRGARGHDVFTFVHSALISHNWRTSSLYQL